MGTWDVQWVEENSLDVATGYKFDPLLTMRETTSSVASQ